MDIVVSILIIIFLFIFMLLILNINKEQEKKHSYMSKRTGKIVHVSHSKFNPNNDDIKHGIVILTHQNYYNFTSKTNLTDKQFISNSPVQPKNDPTIAREEFQFFLKLM